MASYMKTRDLSGGGKRDLRGVMGQIAKQLGKFEDAHFQVRVHGKAGWTTGAVRLRAAGSEADAELVNLPDLEIITDEKTWSEISKGAYSPLKAFLDGKLRVRGNADLGRRILKKLGSGAGETDIV